MADPKPGHRRHPNARDRLIAIAADLLEEGGPAAVTFRELGRRAGLSHNAAHKLYGSKEELLASVAAASLLELHAELDRVDGEGGALGAVRRTMRVYVRQALARPRCFQLTYGSWTPPVPPVLEDAVQQTLSLLHGTIVRAQESGTLPSVAIEADRIAALIQATAHGAVQLSIGGHFGRVRSGDLDADDVVDLLLQVLAPTPSATGPAT